MNPFLDPSTSPFPTVHIYSHFLIPHRGELGPTFGDSKKSNSSEPPAQFLRVSKKRLAVRATRVWYAEPKWLRYPKRKVSNITHRSVYLAE